jgi:hypothetical protein
MGDYTTEERAKRVIIINEEGKAYMCHAEKICRKIKSYRIPFSLEAALWIKRVQVYYSLLRYHKGRVKNRGNLKRAARRCNIPHPLSLTIAEIYDRLKECKRECTFYQEHGKRFLRKHLNARLCLAQKKEDKEAINKISAIIQWEQQQNFWHRLNYCTGKKRTRRATTIQAEVPGGGALSSTPLKSLPSRRYFLRSTSRDTQWLGRPLYVMATCLMRSGIQPTQPPDGPS